MAHSAPLNCRIFTLPGPLFFVVGVSEIYVTYLINLGILAAIAWPTAILGAASVIDNPWSVMTQRTVAAGKELCEVLLSREQVIRFRLHDVMCMYEQECPITNVLAFLGASPCHSNRIQSRCSSDFLLLSGDGQANK